MNLESKDFLVTLIRGPLVAPLGSLNNEPTPPIGLAYLAGALKQAGFQTKGIDCTQQGFGRIHPIAGTKLQYHGVTPEETVALIDPKTKIFAFTSMFSHEWTFVKVVITKIKEAFPQAKIIVGGEHITAIPEYVLNDCPAIDYCGLGEGEETLVEFCSKIRSGESPDSITGISYARDGKYIQNPSRKRIKDVNLIAWPDWEIFPISEYLDHQLSFGASFGRNMPIMASRGCPYMCTFCSNAQMWTNKYFIRTPDDVMKEILYYKEKYAITGLQFYDLTAIVRKEWTIEFCQKLLDSNLHLDWSLPSGTRSEALDEESLKMLAKANLKYLVYAPESGSADTLEKIKKRIKLSDMMKSVRTAVKQGIVVRTNMIIGFPHETRKNIYMTLLTQLKFALLGVEDCPIYPFQPYPGTELFKYLADKGKVKLNDTYFETLASLSTGRFSMPDDSYCEHVGKTELHLYRVISFFLFYVVSYLTRPTRIIRTLRNVFFSEKSATVVEQRLKDMVKRIGKSGPPITQNKAS